MGDLSTETTDEVLAAHAEHGRGGQAAIVWAMRKLRLSNEDLSTKIIWLTGALVIFTLVLIALTAVLVAQSLSAHR